MFSAFILFLLVGGNVAAFDQGVYDAGQRKYNEIVADSRHPKYGPCWTRVLEEVKQGCRKLTEDNQHRIALGFTNCFLAKTGRQTYDGCSEAVDDISNCVKDMDSAAFGAYTNFFTHAQSLCYFLENIRWQENAEMTIGRLIDQTLLFEERLKDWNYSVISFENRTITLQSQLLEAGMRLSNTLDQSQAAVAVMRQASADQHAIIRDVFRQLTSLQEMVVDEFAGFYAYAYYVASTGLAYVLTSTQRTDAARVPLLAVTSATFAVERFMLRQILEFIFSMQGLSQDSVSNTTLHMAVWWLRRVAVFLCLILLTWSATRFRDLHMINHSLLEGVAREQRQLRRIYSQIAYIRQAIRERSLTPTNNDHRNTRKTKGKRDESKDSVTPKPDLESHDFENTKKLKKHVSSLDADDEGDGGNDDTVSIAGSTISTVSNSRYNLRQRTSAAATSPAVNSSLREMTPASTRSSARSRSRSRSRAPATPITTPSSKLNSSRFSEVGEDELLASVEASARRTARSARMARMAVQREEQESLSSR